MMLVNKKISTVRLRLKWNFATLLYLSPKVDAEIYKPLPETS